MSITEDRTRPPPEYHRTVIRPRYSIRGGADRKAPRVWWDRTPEHGARQRSCSTLTGEGDSQYRPSGAKSSTAVQKDRALVPPRLPSQG